MQIDKRLDTGLVSQADQRGCIPGDGVSYRPVFLFNLYTSYPFRETALYFLLNKALSADSVRETMHYPGL